MPETGHMTLGLQEQWPPVGATCQSLTPEEADDVFFPGAGGKPTKAKVLCASCPNEQKCLEYAIRYKLDGFYAGTTRKERDIMAEQFGIPQMPISDMLSKLLPEAGKRRRYRHVMPPPPDTIEQLEDLEGPELELVAS